ncbi:MAG: metallophosphoesterase family protein [Planctomycetota bacterium]
MRYAILSDIHGNLTALRSVLSTLDRLAVDVYACLGDVVGYGPDPSPCLRELRKYNALFVAGNHDYAVCGKIDTANFNSYARSAIQWTRQSLSPADLDFLGALPLVLHLDGLDLVHGSLYAPELFDYVQTSYDAFLTMERMHAPVCFVGHSHVPVTFVQEQVICYRIDTEISVRPFGKVIVNVGSVGQPRDKDPRASFAIYDTDKELVTIHRVPYDTDYAAKRVRLAGLPAPLGERLRLGR